MIIFAFCHFDTLRRQLSLHYDARPLPLANIWLLSAARHYIRYCQLTATFIEAFKILIFIRHYAYAITLTLDEPQELSPLPPPAAAASIYDVAISFSLPYFHSFTILPLVAFMIRQRHFDTLLSPMLPMADSLLRRHYFRHWCCHYVYAIDIAITIHYAIDDITLPLLRTCWCWWCRFSLITPFIFSDYHAAAFATLNILMTLHSHWYADSVIDLLRHYFHFNIIISPSLPRWLHCFRHFAALYAAIITPCCFRCCCW